MFCVALSTALYLVQMVRGVEWVQCVCLYFFRVARVEDESVLGFANVESSGLVDNQVHVHAQLNDVNNIYC